MSARQGTPMNFVMSENDVKALAAYVPSEPWEYEIKRIFMLMLLTGASMEDARKFSRSNISNNGDTLFYTTAHGMDVSIRKHELIDLYIDGKIKYNRQSRTISNGLKSLFRYAEINSPVIDEDGDRHKMCDVITMSVARYTFATRMYHEGHTVQQIMDMMGTTSRVFIARAIQGYKKKTYKPRSK